MPQTPPLHDAALALAAGTESSASAAGSAAGPVHGSAAGSAAGSLSEPVVPLYGTSTLAQLLPAAAARCGVPGLSDVLGLPDATAYVVMLVDGLGASLLDENAHAAPFLASLRGRAPLTACVPSTTATSITSLGTGLEPGRHGVVGYTSRIPGTMTLLNALTWDGRTDPVQWQPYQSVFAQVQAAGGHATVVSRGSFVGSGLTRVSQRGASYVAAESAWERVDCTAEVAELPGSLTYTYVSTLDHTGHERGCSSPEWVQTLREIDAEAAALRDALPEGTGLIITGDHGMLDVPDDRRIDADASSTLTDGVLLLGGEARFRHLWTAAGAADDVAATWQAELGDRAWVLTRDEAVQAGWFGSVDDAVRPRMGDVMVAARDDWAVLASRLFPVETKMRGFHGSLTPTEMYVPLLVDVVGT